MAWTLIPSPRDAHHMENRLLRQSAFQQATRFRRYTECFHRTEYFSSRWRKPMLHAGRTPHANWKSKHEFRSQHLALNRWAGTLTCEKDSPHLPALKKIVTRKTLHVLRKIQELHHQPNAKDDKRQSER